MRLPAGGHDPPRTARAKRSLPLLLKSTAPEPKTTTHAKLSLLADVEDDQ
jgi:hypothetical protein